MHSFNTGLETPNQVVIMIVLWVSLGKGKLSGVSVTIWRTSHKPTQMRGSKNRQSEKKTGQKAISDRRKTEVKKVNPQYNSPQANFSPGLEYREYNMSEGKLYSVYFYDLYCGVEEVEVSRIQV